MKCPACVQGSYKPMRKRLQPNSTQGKGYSEPLTEEKETGFRFFSNSAICSSHTTCHVADRAPALGEVAS